MEDRLETEQQLGGASSSLALMAEADEDAGLSPEVQALIARCMNGTEPYEDEISGAVKKDWHQQKFSQLHVRMVMLKVAGFRNMEIADIFGQDVSRVSVTMAHPYAKKITRALIPKSAAKVIDLRSRLEIYSGELLDHAFALAMKSPDVKEVREVTFGFLDRAGYNVVTKTATAVVKPTELDSAGSTILGRMASALDESSAIDSAIMPNWKTPVPPDDSSMAPSEEGAPVPASDWDPARPEVAQPQRALAPFSEGSQRTGTDN